MIEYETDTDSCDDSIPIAHVVPTTHVVVNIADPVEGYDDHVVYSPHRAQYIRNREDYVRIYLIKKALLKAFCAALLLLLLFFYFVVYI